MKYPENRKICQECKGRCCKNIPGIVSPKDLKLPKTYLLKKYIISGKYTIDYWIGDPRTNKNELEQVYFIRPSVKGKEGEIPNASWGGECTFLTVKGCILKINKRPLQCQMLKPHKYKCIIINKYSKKNLIIQWIPYQNIIQNLINNIS